jgi:hypothetical protein
MPASHIYITTTIPYVNAQPHFGFALELVQAAAFIACAGTGDLETVREENLTGAATRF